MLPTKKNQSKLKLPRNADSNLFIELFNSDASERYVMHRFFEQTDSCDISRLKDIKFLAKTSFPAAGKFTDLVHSIYNQENANNYTSMDQFVEDFLEKIESELNELCAGIAEHCE